MAVVKYRDKEDGTWKKTLGGGNTSDATAVKYIEQTLTDEQKLQARTNIEADKIYVSDTEPDVPDGSFWLDTSDENHDNFSDLINAIYPVGSIYMSVNNVSPSILFGGIWEQIKDTFLLSAGDTYTAGATGGEATHTLTTAEMPNHYHQVGIGLINGTNDLDWTSSIGSTDRNAWGINYNSPAATNAIYARAVGGSGAHNNMPPYLAVFVWKRVS